MLPALLVPLGTQERPLEPRLRPLHARLALQAGKALAPVWAQLDVRRALPATTSRLREMLSVLLVKLENTIQTRVGTLASPANQDPTATRLELSPARRASPAKLDIGRQ